MINRSSLPSLLKLIKDFPSVALLGPRQVGKTTLAKAIIKTSKRDSVYLDLEDHDDFNALANPKLFFTQNRNKLIVIDEVQRKPELFPALRSEIDAHRKPSRFLLLGSASVDLLKQSSESLAGRIIYKELSPLSFNEVKDKYSMERHWLRGGFPEAVAARNAELWRLWQQSFVRTYIERDLPMLGLSASPHDVNRLLHMLAYNNGQVLNKSEYAKTLSLSVPTISMMIDYLSNAFLVRLLQPFSTNAKKRIIKTPRLYLRDSGMLHFLLNVKDANSLLKNPKAGFSWEGYVIEQVIEKTGDDRDYYYYRTQDGTEADLVICSHHTPEIIVEAKMSSSPSISKSLFNSMEDLKVKKGFIVIPGSGISFPLSKNVQVNSLDVFLEKKI
ncbi:ATPase [Bacteroidota bacterium]|nr:ATPase [Bacteroidota bacterium]